MLSGTYSHSLMPSSCFMCLVFAIFIQLSYFVAVLAYIFSCANPAKWLNRTRKILPLHLYKIKINSPPRPYIYIYVCFAWICYPWPRSSYPLPRASAGNCKRRASVGNAPSCDTRFCRFRVTAFEIQIFSFTKSLCFHFAGLTTGALK